MTKFKLTSYQDFGHCQLNYRTKNSVGQTLVYCLQDQGEKFGGVRLMRCSQDFEPSHTATPRERCDFERPVVTDRDSNYAVKLKDLCNQWIDEHERQFQTTGEK